MERPLTGWLLAAFAAVVLLLAYGERFSPLVQTTFGLDLGASGSDAVVLRVYPGSGAAKISVQPGDLVLISRLSLSDRYRLFTGSSPVGTAVTVPIAHRGDRRTITLRAEQSARSNGESFSPARSLAGAVALLGNATLTLVIVAFIAWRRPSLATAALVFYGAGSITTFAVVGEFSSIPDPWYGIVAVIITAAFSTLPLLALLPFIVRFPQLPTTPTARLRLRIADGIVIVAALLFVLESIYEPLLFVTWSGLDTWEQLVCGVLILTFATLAYRETSGEARRRIGWVIAGFVLSAIAYTTFDLADTVAYTGGSSVARVVSDVALGLQCALPIALAYAILRHRVLDIGFALNRTVVYAVMTTLVVGVVSFADWLTSRLLNEQRLALTIEAIVTILFGFALNWIHGRTERIIDRIVFRQRHTAEKRVEYRILALGFAASVGAVNEALAEDAPQILNLSSAAVFGRLSATVPFRLTASSGWPEDAATAIDADSILVRTLRALERPIFLDDVAIAPATFPSGAARPVIAVPIVAQHELTGFALYGNHRDGALPDPEEISLLARLTAAAGNAYGAVEARQWRERVATLEESIRGMATIVPPGNLA
ncbi:MAG TPA: hypothetical protein VMS32_04865 [Verrucomicrobiae bacterium]|jgi:hypothetical protein|nr:hypothetical protein [Verrucomicrobiae bacterium]